jgi:two-component system nitrate/nitrite response regulator NarL
LNDLTTNSAQRQIRFGCNDDNPAMQITNEANQVKVVIVDDHTMIVELITDIFGKWDGYKVVGHASNCQDALAICQREKPDFVILDVGLPDASGLEAFKQIKALFPKVHVLIFSGNLNDTIIRKALMAGVDGIISKASATAELKTAILSVSTGRTYLCSQTSEAVRLMVRSPAVPPASRPALSKREQTVLRHIAAGLSSKEIAAKLGLSCYTVNNFRAKLSKKTGLHRAVHLSLYAARMGLINEPAGSAHPGW